MTLRADASPVGFLNQRHATPLHIQHGQPRQPNCISIQAENGHPTVLTEPAISVIPAIGSVPLDVGVMAACVGRLAGRSLAAVFGKVAEQSIHLGEVGSIDQIAA